MNAKTVLAAKTLAFGAALMLSSASLVRAGGTAAPAAAAAEPRLFGAVVADAVHAKATVEKIDYLSRVAVLKMEDGTLKSITAGPEVQRLNEILPGDTIEMVYAETVVVLAGDNAGAPARRESTEIQRTGKDEAPGAIIAKTTKVLATVEALDFKARTATLKGPHRTVTVNVPADAVNFEKMKVGDSVYLEFTQAIAAAVTKTAPKPAN